MGMIQVTTGKVIDIVNVVFKIVIFDLITTNIDACKFKGLFDLYE